MTTITKVERIADYIIDFEELTAVAMIEYIEKTHHEWLKQILPETMKLAGTIMETHGMEHRELFELHRLFGNLKIELEQHIVKEEQILFPVIRNYGYHKTKNLYYKALNVLKDIEMEHNDTGALIERIKKITDDYRLPLDATPEYVEAFNNLAAIEEDMIQHIHLENDILFERVQMGVYEEPKMA